MIRLTKLEEEIIKILWKLEKAFPKVIISHLKEPIPPYNTVLSAIRKLEKLGYIGYTKYGKSHEYYPKLMKEQYGKSIFKNLYNNILKKSNADLFSYFIEQNENIDVEELEKLIKKLKDKSHD